MQKKDLMVENYLYQAKRLMQADYDVFDLMAETFLERCVRFLKRSIV